MAARINNVVQKIIPPALPPADAFSGQTILVTGGTSGLGVAAAVHYLNLGAKEVIITARKATSARAEEAKQRILAQTSGGKKSKTKNSSNGKGEVTIMELDMNSYASCLSLVDSLKAKYAAGGLDVVVLNAGSMNNEFVKSPAGSEETIQVNAISTTLLALLLLPWLKQQHRERKGVSPTPHLVFVGSGSHLEVDIKSWPSYVAQDGGVIAHYSKKDNHSSSAIDTTMYATSKLILQYAIEEVSKLALGSNGQPEVIVTTVCPGPVATDIARNISGNSIVARILIPIFFLAQAKSPDYGARIYVNASVAKPEIHGKFLRDYLSDKQYEAQSKRMISSPEARKMQTEIWKEIRETLLVQVPAVRDTLQQLQQQ